MVDDFYQVYVSLYILCVFKKCYLEQIEHVSNFYCTLKCKNCSASIPYLSGMKNPSEENMKREIDLLFSKVDYVHIYDLTGGESFLVSDKLAQLIPYLCENYRGRFGKIWILTNATILPTENLLQALEKYKDYVKIMISYYDTVPGWNEKFLKLQNLFEARGLHFDVINSKYWIDMGFGKKDNVQKFSDKEVEDYFDLCIAGCRAYTNGKLYYCGLSYLAYEAFYKEVYEEDEYIDIADPELSKEVFVEYNIGYSTKGYYEPCRNCYGLFNRNLHIVPKAEQICEESKNDKISTDLHN